MGKTRHPTNMEEELGELNRRSKECRSIPFGLERMACFDYYVLPLLDKLNGLGFSVEWDIDKQEYMLVELVKDERGWVHPTIKRR